MQQATLNFEPGLTAQFPRLRDLMVAVVYGSRRSLQGVASDLDHSPSELSRMLNREQEDPRKLDVEDFVAILTSTGDMRPIYWLIEKFLRDPAQTRAEATAEIARLLPMLAALAEQAGITNPKAKR